jgi:hypothetical protein
MFYYIGWIIVFIFILYITHLLSQHVRFILISCIKLCVALTITLTLALFVFIHEHMDQDKLQEAFTVAYSRMEEFRNAQL